MALVMRTMRTLLFIFGLLHTATAATTYTVGGNVGWTFQTSNSFYDDQFKNIALNVGDSLLFPYTSPVHNVFKVSQADLRSCNGNNAIAQHTETNATVTLQTPGYHGFICEIAGHCQGGMHLEVTVLADTPTAAPVVAPAPAPFVAPVAPVPASSPAITPAPAPASPPPASTITPVPVSPPANTPANVPATVTPAPAPVSPAPAPVSPAPAPVFPAPVTPPANDTPAPLPSPGATSPPASPGIIIPPSAEAPGPSSEGPNGSASGLQLRLSIAVGALVVGCAAGLL